MLSRLGTLFTRFTRGAVSSRIQSGSSYEGIAPFHCLYAYMLPPDARNMADVAQANDGQVETTDLKAQDAPVPSAATQPQPAVRPAETRYKRTFYKRVLPTPPCIDFSSDQGKIIFQEAMAAGHMNGFFKLIQQFTTQGEPAFCGITSLSVVMNALEIDPKRIWKGAWRWYAEDMMDCCKSLDDIKKEGITIQQAACLATCNGVNVELRHFGTFALDHFRQLVAGCTASGHEHLIVSYSRKVFQQTGDGHFSPVGGFHPQKDLVLILDTARFKYPPHWVPLEMLYNAMQAADSVTGKSRGFLKLWPRNRRRSIAFTLGIQGNWEPLHSFVTSGAATVLGSALANPDATADSCITALVQSIPQEAVAETIMMRNLEDICNHHMGRAQQQVLHELSHIPLFAVVETALRTTPLVVGPPEEGGDDGAAPAAAAIGGTAYHAAQRAMVERCTMLLLLCRPLVQRLEGVADGDVLAKVVELLCAEQSSLVMDEVAFLAEQVDKLAVLDGSDRLSDGVSFVCNGCNSKCQAP